MRTIRSPTSRSAEPLVVLGGLGLLHLARHAPRLDAPNHVLSDAAGFVGAVVGQPLRSTLATWGATLVLLVVVRRRAAGDHPHHHPHRGRTRVGRRRRRQSARSTARFARLFRRLTDLRGRQRRPRRRARTEPDVRRSRRFVGLRRAPTSASTTRTPTAGRAARAQGQGARSSRCRWTTARPSNWPSTSVRAPSSRRGSCRRPSCSAVPAATASTGSSSRTPGCRLEHALAEHGVETRLVGMVVGPDRHPLRAGARARRQGRRGHEPAQGHRLRDGHAGRAHPRPDPRQAGDRGGDPERPQTAGHRGRHPDQRRGPQGQPSARGGHRPQHRRPFRHGQPGEHAPHPHRRRDRRGQVVLPELAADVDPDAVDARPGPHDPGRPEAGRDGPVQQASAPADRGGDQPQEGRERAGLGRAGDGAALRPAGRGRLPRCHRATTRRSIAAISSIRTPSCSGPTPRASRPITGCRSSSW